MTSIPVLGWREAVGLPEFGLSGIPAKIDTGARTSALHATHIEMVEREGVAHARFRIDLGHGHETALCEACHVSRRKITSSNGLSEERLVVTTRLELGGELFDAEFSLTDRSDMVHPVLIGRTALRKRFLVDPARTFLKSQRSALLYQNPGSQGA
ncbi:ATP-dependent zinc protease [Altererythrobacter fulvus]|uniref:ATP-dependent zinc protease family protein n=1 Tax=Caenibius fulvus TaxID=2126012 RepID=UPI00301B5622